MFPAHVSFLRQLLPAASYSILVLLPMCSVRDSTTPTSSSIRRTEQCHYFPLSCIDQHINSLTSASHSGSLGASPTLSSTRPFGFPTPEHTGSLTAISPHLPSTASLF